MIRISRVRLRIRAQTALAGGVRALGLLALAAVLVLGLSQMVARGWQSPLAALLSGLDPRLHPIGWALATLGAMAGGTVLWMWRQGPTLTETARLCDRRVSQTGDNGDRVYVALHLARRGEDPWVAALLAQAAGDLRRLDPARAWPWRRPRGTLGLLALAALAATLVTLEAPAPAARASGRSSSAGDLADLADPALLGAEARLLTLIERIREGRGDLVSRDELTALARLAAQSEARQAGYSERLRELAEDLSKDEATRALGQALAQALADERGKTRAEAKTRAGVEMGPVEQATHRLAGHRLAGHRLAGDIEGADGAAKRLAQSLLYAATRLDTRTETPGATTPRSLPGLEAPPTAMAPEPTPAGPGQGAPSRKGARAAGNRSGAGPAGPNEGRLFSQGDGSQAVPATGATPDDPTGGGAAGGGADRRLKRLRRDLERAASACEDPRACPSALDQLGRSLDQHVRAARGRKAERLADLAQRALEPLSAPQRARGAGTPQPRAEGRGPAAGARSKEPASGAAGETSEPGAPGLGGGLGPGSGSGAGSPEAAEPHGGAVPALFAGRGQSLAAPLAEGPGPSRAQVIEAAGSEGFSPAAYREVFRAYRAAVEEVLDDGRVPDHRRRVVQRYFELIRPGSPSP